MHPLEKTDPNVARANRLYWDSGRSVNQIADEMDLSKGMLYEMIRPLETGLACPRCSVETHYANRTARERGLVTCPSCGAEVDQREAAAATSPAEAADDRPILPRRAAPGPRRGPDAVRIGAGLLLIATGIWLFRGLRKR